MLQSYVMSKTKKTSIEEKLIQSLASLDKNTTLLLAVSGGADSICMLSLCAQYAKLRNQKIIVASLNHNLRSEKESQKDLDFVKDFCKELGILCLVKTAEPGFIKTLAGKRKKGLEEAARFYRYAFLEDSAKEQGASYILTAHNKNDKLETILERFLQGSLARSGMEIMRGNYVKPLLDCSRDEIEDYLEKNNIEYCIDKTNAETIFLRNKIRNRLVVFLNTYFWGWQKALLQGAKKQAIDEDFFTELLDSYAFSMRDAKTAVYEKEAFFSLHKAIQTRLLYKSFSQLSVHSRISYAVIEQILAKQGIETDEIIVFFDNQNIIVQKKDNKERAKKGKKNFYAIVEKECKFITNYATISIDRADEKTDYVKGQVIAYKKKLPFALSYDGENAKLDFFHQEAEADKKYLQLHIENKRGYK